jgi:hypothetical protein
VFLKHFTARKFAAIAMTSRVTAIAVAFEVFSFLSIGLFPLVEDVKTF